MGNVKRESGDYEAALVEYEKAINLSPKDGIGYGCKGCVLYDICSQEFYDNKDKFTKKNKARLHEAIKILDKALDLPMNLELKILDKPFDSPENLELRWWVQDATNCKRGALMLLKK